MTEPKPKKEPICVFTRQPGTYVKSYTYPVQVERDWHRPVFHPGTTVELGTDAEYRCGDCGKSLD